LYVTYAFDKIHNTGEMTHALLICQLKFLVWTVWRCRFNDKSVNTTWHFWWECFYVFLWKVGLYV